MGAIHRRRFQPLQPLHRFMAWAAEISRRDFLRQAATAAAGAATLPLAGCGNSNLPSAIASSPGPISTLPPVVVAPSMAAFMHGVASGDPLTDGVILWTRVTPDAASLAANAVLVVDYVLSLTPDLANPVLSSQFVTNSERDYTVKPDVRGLNSYTAYYFQFAVTLADGTIVRSPKGRTRTAPKATDTNRLRMVSASCQNMAFGFFNSHAAIAAKAADIDVMLHLGDYIYETGGASQIAGRSPMPAREIISLADYRQRHAQYKTDPDLQACHRQIPFICIWDDHETTNNSYRASADNHTAGPMAEGCWEERMGWAIRAYFEWMPIRDNPVVAFDAPTPAACPGVPLSGYLPEGNGSIQRLFRYGDLADIIMLDTRLAARAEQNGTTTVTPEQTFLGDAQRAFLLNALETSTARWKFVAQQMTFAPIKVVPLPESMGGTFLNEDAWDGYRFDRNAVMNHIASKAIQNVVVLSGDTHVVTAFDLPIEPSDPTRYNPATGAGSLAVEFSCNGVANVGIIGEFFMANNPHLKYSNLTLQGYLLLDVDATRVQGEYFFTGVPQNRSPVETFGRALICANNTQRLTMGTTASPARMGAPVLAP
jgi:alkaline phosphatase D